mgnify:CR=1 FL=1
MENVLYFASVGLIVLISLYAILKILIKKFNPEESKVNIYGILQGMKNTEIISLSCSIVSYIFLLYIMASFIDLNLYIALISLSLGVTNLLPIPALDGGKILLLIIEAIRKKPLNERTEINIQLIGCSILIALSLYITYNDILRIF